ncbi:MAG: hypothetical protein P1U88_07285, partial [Thalassobaculaceae bacterium]|nr:hypothetical protein [Thalassobaculaceae bacterium]
LKSDLKNVSSYECKFSILRNGICEIFPIEESFSEEFGFNISPLSDKKEEQLFYLTSQVYFFLKDLGHSHQHHSPKTDTLVDIQEVHSDDDHSWKQNITYSLYRRVVDFRRSTQRGSNEDALGILAYAKTFRMVSKFDEIPDQAVSFYDGHVIESVRAGEAKSTVEFQQKEIRSNSIRNLVVFAVGTLLSFIGLLRVGQYDKDKLVIPESMIYIAKLVLHLPLHTFAFIIIIGLLVSELEKSSDRIRGGFVLAAARILLAYRKLPAVLFSMILTTIITGSGIFLVILNS